MDEQTLELQIKTKSQETISILDKLMSKLTGIEKNIGDVGRKTNNISTKTANKEFDNLDKTINKASKSMSNLKKVFTFVGTKKITKTGLEWINEAVDQTEQLNLFNVVFKNVEKNGTIMYSKLGKEAVDFQHKLNETFGTNKTQTLYMQGIFQSMGENVGISDNYSAIMSETMTKLTYDLASLYNKSETTTAEAIRAGVYAGQTKPLRSYGIDVTQMSMQPIVNQLGITDENGDIKSVKNMSQAEKEILRYIATLNQAKVAMGDLANTIDSPSNQMKIFRQQLTETKVAISSLFMGLYSNVLPYANAFLMVIKEISKAIASMFGIKLKDFNTGIASQEGVYDGLTDSVDNAVDSVKELRRQTLGFDEIHNINENRNNGSSGTSISGGIDQKLLDAIKGYDNGMESVRMKATQIRDNIMDWLGFTKKTNLLTGETYFEYEGIDKTIKNIWESFKGLSTTGKILVGLGLASSGIKLWNTGKKLLNIFGDSGLGKAITNLLSPMKSLYGSLDNVNYANKSLNKGLSEGISSWSKNLTMIDRAKVALVGYVGLKIGIEGMTSAFKDASKEGWNLGNSLQAIASGGTAIASGAFIGSIFGPLGTIIGGALGALIALKETLDETMVVGTDYLEKTKASVELTNEFCESIKNTSNAITDNLNKNLAMTDQHKILLKELESLADSNGNIKEGYEDRAKFILGELSKAYGIEYTLVGNTISQYDQLIGKIKTSIETKQAELLLSAYEQKYANAIQNKTKLYDELVKKEKDYKDAKDRAIATENYAKEVWEKNSVALRAYYGSYDKYMEAMAGNTKKAMKIQEKAWKDASNTYFECENDINNYSNLSTAIQTGNMELIRKSINKATNTYVKDGEIVTRTLSEQLIREKQIAEDKIKDMEETAGKVDEITKNSAYSQLNTTIDLLVSQSKFISGITPEIVDAWGTLAGQSEERFLTELNKLPEDIQTYIVNEMQSKGYAISSELQAGINKNSPNIKVTADTRNANNTISNFLSNINREINFVVSASVGGSFGGGSGGGRFANGGIYSGGKWHDITQYADGGLPTMGEMFIAREAGPELVGSIGRKTAVMNNGQIVDSVAKGVYNAVIAASGQTNGSSNGVELYLHTDEGVIVDRINQKTKQTGICPIEIPT